MKWRVEVIASSMNSASNYYYDSASRSSVSRSSGGRVKRRCLEKHHVASYRRPVFEEPLRRSKREKRLLFATFNVSQMDKQILGRADTDFSEVSNGQTA